MLPLHQICCCYFEQWFFVEPLERQPCIAPHHSNTCHLSLRGLCWVHLFLCLTPPVLIPGLALLDGGSIFLFLYLALCFHIFIILHFKCFYIWYVYYTIHRTSCIFCSLSLSTWGRKFVGPRFVCGLCTLQISYVLTTQKHMILCYGMIWYDMMMW